MSEDERRFCCECGFVLDYSDTNICWFCLRDGRNQDDEGETMTTQVAEFLLNMLHMGLARGEANAKAYDYALALLLEKEARGSQVTATMMTQALELVREAWTSQPLKYYLQEIMLQERAKR